MMEPTRLAVIAHAPSGQEFDVPTWIEDYDVDGMDGVGWAVLTKDPLKAKVFDSVAEAMNEYLKTSTVKPIRYDGKPNRPLTAYTVLIEPIDE